MEAKGKGACVKVEEVGADKEHGGEERVCREETITHYIHTYPPNLFQ